MADVDVLTYGFALSNEGGVAASLTYTVTPVRPVNIDLVQK